MNRDNEPSSIIRIGTQVDVEPIDFTIKDTYDVVARSVAEFCNCRNCQLVDIDVFIYFEDGDAHIMTYNDDITDAFVANQPLSALNEYVQIIQATSDVVKETPNYIVNGKIIFIIKLRTRGSSPVDITIPLWVNDVINVICMDAQAFAKCIKDELLRSYRRKDININAINVDSKGIITDKDTRGYYYR